MTSLEDSQAVVVMIVPPNLEEPIVDWLLSRDNGVGFTSFPVSGHSTDHEHMSAAEQVSGRQRRQQFQVQMETRAVDPFVAELQGRFGSTNIHFWVLPVMRVGNVSDFV